MDDERDGDGEMVVEGNEELEGVPEPVPANLADPKPSRSEKERKMAAEGIIPNQKVMVKRLGPDRVVNPATNLAVRCEGQYKVWKGQFTRDEIEEMIHGYFGGGLMRVVQQQDDLTDEKNYGKMMGRFNLKFPGEPNLENVLADCLTSSPVPAGIPGQAPAIAALPDDPAAKITREAAAMEAEKRRLASEDELVEARLTSSRRRRALKRADELRERLEEQEDGGPFAFEGPPGPGSRLPVPFRPGMGGFGRGGPPAPYSEMDAPVSFKDQLHQREVDAAREEARRLADKLERLAEESRKPKTDITETISVMVTAMTPLITEMMKVRADSERSRQAQQDNLMKIVLDSGNRSEKTMELIMTAIGLRDKRDGQSFDQMLRLIEVGKDMGAGEGEGGGTVIEQIGKAGGDLIGGIVAALQAGKQQAPAPAAHMMPQLPVLRPPELPRPGASLPAHPQAALPAPPRINPAQEVRSAPENHQVKPGPQGEGQPMDDAKLKALAKAIVNAAMGELDAKPEEPRWVKLAYDHLPDDWIEAIANADSYNDLVEMAKPYAPMDILFFQFWPKLKGDPGAQPWLEKGFASLQKLCKDATVEEGGGEGEGSGGGDFNDGEVAP